MDNSTEDNGDLGNKEHEITGVSESDKSDTNAKLKRRQKRIKILMKTLLIHS